MAKVLRKAMKGMGTNEKKLIEVICTSTFEEMQDISAEFTGEFKGRDLIADIKSETSGNFERLLVGLITPRAQYDAVLLRKAMKGLGTDEDMLTEVLCNRNGEEIKAIISAFEEEYKGRDLIADIESENSGNLEKLYLKLLEGDDEDKDPDDEDAVAADVEKLFNAGQNKIGTDEGVFIRLLAGPSRLYVEKINWAYAEAHGKALSKVIKSEFRGSLEKALVTLVTPRSETYSEILFKAMDGIGTNEATIIRVLVTMKERSLQQIAEKYLEKHGKTAEAHLKSETSGNFRRAIQSVMDNFAKLGQD